MLYSVRNKKLEASSSFFVWKIFALGMFSTLEKYKTGDCISTRQYLSLTKSSTFSSLTKLIKSQSGLMG